MMGCRLVGWWGRAGGDIHFEFSAIANGVAYPRPQHGTLCRPGRSILLTSQQNLVSMLRSCANVMNKIAKVNFTF